ncbi:MAG: hypothetical protein Q4C70_14115, partial [Planctomycetia bacterium]|nr:hypothetical protein [Planctomycetia bacterium]
MSRIFTTALSLLLVLSLGSVSLANDRAKEVKNKVKNLAKNAQVAKLADKPMEGAEEVDLFQAIADDQIEVGILQPNMKGGKILVKNKTDKPLSIRMPKAFGTRPVMGQMAGGDQNQLIGGGGLGGMGGMGSRNGSGATGTINEPIDDSYSSTQFFDIFLKDEEYLSKYHSYYNELIEGYVNSGRFEETYNR